MIFAVFTEELLAAMESESGGDVQIRVSNQPPVRLNPDRAFYRDYSRVPTSCPEITFLPTLDNRLFAVPWKLLCQCLVGTKRVAVGFNCRVELKYIADSFQFQFFGATK